MALPRTFPILGLELRGGAFGKHGDSSSSSPRPTFQQATVTSLWMRFAMPSARSLPYLNVIRSSRMDQKAYREVTRGRF